MLIPVKLFSETTPSGSVSRDVRKKDNLDLKKKMANDVKISFVDESDFKKQVKIDPYKYLNVSSLHTDTSVSKTDINDWLIFAEFHLYVSY